jgi:hypothetical protein
VTCPCGCGGTVKPKRKYARAGCSGRVFFRQPQPRAWHIAAGKASAARAHRKLMLECEGMTTEQAFKHGLKLGYGRAMKRWQRWAHEYVRRLGQAALRMR